MNRRWAKVPNYGAIIRVRFVSDGFGSSTLETQSCRQATRKGKDSPFARSSRPVISQLYINVRLLQNMICDFDDTSEGVYPTGEPDSDQRGLALLPDPPPLLRPPPLLPDGKHHWKRLKLR
jgi:hypothetical protein